MERYEAKLGVMAFIGVFDELMRTVVPVSVLLSLFNHYYMIIMLSVFLSKVFALVQDETPQAADKQIATQQYYSTLNCTQYLDSLYPATCSRLRN